jgi:hypothetical protein
MKSPVRRTIALGITSGAAALSVLKVYDLAVTLFQREGSGWLIEPWYYLGFIEEVCLIAVVCEITRQVVLRRARWLRFALLALLFVAAWTNSRYWFISPYAMLTIGVGLIGLYIETLVCDLKEIARSAKEPNQALEPTATAVTDRAAHAPRQP